MNKPMVFIQIASLDDSELSHTIEDAIYKAKYPERLVFGVYLHYKTDVAKQELLDYADRLSSRSTFRLELETFNKAHLGVGRARYKANSMYNGEDYVLQIDAHSWFQLHWDELLIDLLKGCSDKTILTGIAPPYISKNGIRKALEPGFLYPKWNSKKEPVDWLKNWEPYRTNSEFHLVASKFSACFAFGDSSWGGRGVDKNSIFWSEEPIQTYNLEKEGFTLLVPSVSYPLICHLYEKDIEGEGGKRAGISSYVTKEEFDELMEKDKQYYQSLFKTTTSLTSQENTN